MSFSTSANLLRRSSTQTGEELYHSIYTDESSNGTYLYDSKSEFVKKQSQVYETPSATAVDDVDVDSETCENSQNDVFQLPVYSVDVQKSFAQEKQPLRQTQTKRESLWNRLLSCFSATPMKKDDSTVMSNSDEGTTDNSGSTALRKAISPLLPPLDSEPKKHRKTLVLDLDETLVHTSFEPICNPDLVIDFEMNGAHYKAFVKKRPGVDEFLKLSGELFEVVVYTASLAKYADPVLDYLDITCTIAKRLFRNECVFDRGVFVKDLSRLGRDLAHVAIVDNSPCSYVYHPSNAIPIESWFNDEHDTALLDMIPLLREMADTDDVVQMLSDRGVSPTSRQFH